MRRTWHTFRSEVTAGGELVTAGRTIGSTRTFARKADAERFLASVENRKNLGEWINPQLGRTTFSAWLERWSGTVVHLKPNTLAGYESLLRCYILPVFGDIPLARIEPVDVRDWVAAMVDHG